jgi:WD40 repeat protein
MDQDTASSAPSSGADLKPPRVAPLIPDYEVLCRIGGGSYGEVWLARTVTGTHRAVKVVYRDRFSNGRPYEREFEGISNFEPLSQSHPHQVSIYHVGGNQAAGYFYYVMELADDLRLGRKIDPTCYEPKTLRSVLHDRGRLPVTEALGIGLELTTALKELHDAGLIHRDIKPSNVIFVEGRPKLADMGLVAAADQDCSFVGTEGYVPAEGPGKVQADIYSLGKVLYEMFTGLRPDRFPSLPEDLAFGADVDAKELNAVILKACEVNVTRRYQNAAEMASDLDLLKRGKSLLRLRKLEQAYRRLLVLSAAAVGSLVLAGLVFGFFFFKKRAEGQTLLRELRELQLSRTRRPWASWFARNWPRLGAAAALGTDNQVLEQASAMLAGLDARLVKTLDDVAGDCCAFGPGGRAIISGLGTNPAVIMDTNGMTTPLPICGAGPVCWPDTGPPLQLAAFSNSLVVREGLTGKVRRTLLQLEQIGTNSANSMILALAPDGSGAALGLRGQVSVWSLKSGALLGRVSGNATALAFSTDGSQLGIGWANGSTCVCPVTSPKDQVVLPATSRPSPIRALAFTRDRVSPNPEGTQDNSWLVATAGQGTEIVIWDLRRRLPRFYCRGSPWTVNALAFHPDGLILASAGQAEGRLWDITHEVPALCFSTGAAQVRFVAFDRQGTHLAFGSEIELWKPVVSLWQLEVGRGIYPLYGLKAAARRVWFSPNGRRLAALSDDWQLGIWSIESYRLFRLLEAPVGILADNAGGAFDSTGDRFAFASGYEACLFDLGRSTVVQKWSLARGFADQMQYDPQGRLLLLRRETNAVGSGWSWRLFQLTESQEPLLLHEQGDTNWSALGLTFLAGGRRFLAWNGRPGESQQVIHAIDVASGRELWRATNCPANIAMQVVLDPAQERFGYLTANPKGSTILSASTFQPIGRVDRNSQGVDVSGDQFLLNQWLVSGRPGVQKIPLMTDWAQLGFVSAFSPDGKHLACGTEEGVVVVADLPEVRHRMALLRAAQSASAP